MDNWIKWNYSEIVDFGGALIQDKRFTIARTENSYISERM